MAIYHSLEVGMRSLGGITLKFISSNVSADSLFVYSKAESIIEDYTVRVLALATISVPPRSFVVQTKNLCWLGRGEVQESRIIIAWVGGAKMVTRIHPREWITLLKKIQFFIFKILTALSIGLIRHLLVLQRVSDDWLIIYTDSRYRMFVNIVMTLWSQILVLLQ